MPKDLTVLNPSGAELVSALDTKEFKEIVKKHYAPGASDTEIAFLLGEAKANGLDPRKKECYFIPMQTWVTAMGAYVTKWSMQTGIDTFRKRGMNTGQVDIISSNPLWVNKAGELVQWRNVPRMFSKDGMPSVPDMAVCSIKRKDMSVPVEHVVYWTEYAKVKKDKKTGEESPYGMWKNMPGNQLCKCAESGAWRKAFPDKFGGIYTTDEMEQAAKKPAGTEIKPRPQAVRPRAAQPEPIEPTPETVQPPPKEKPKQVAPPQNPPQIVPKDPKHDNVFQLWEAMNIELNQCTTVEQLNSFTKVRKVELSQIQKENAELFEKISGRWGEMFRVRSAQEQSEKEMETPGDPEEQPTIDEVAAANKKRIEKDSKTAIKMMTASQHKSLLGIVKGLNDASLKEDANADAFVSFLFGSPDTSQVPRDRARKCISYYAGGKNQKHLTGRLDEFVAKLPDPAG